MGNVIALHFSSTATFFMLFDFGNNPPPQVVLLVFGGNPYLDFHNDNRI